MRNIMNSIDYKIEDFDVEEKEIGHGGFATVYRATCKKPPLEKVAIKKIKKRPQNCDRKKIQERIKAERSIHPHLKHDNIVQCYATFEDDEYVYLVLELCNKTLEKFIKEEYKKFAISDYVAYNIIKQLVEGILYLHKKNIIHRDLSLRNILLTKDLKVKICDFGFATQLENKNEEKYSALGTPSFQSPEIKSGKSHSMKTDSWSLGCIIFAILGGKLPVNSEIDVGATIKDTLKRDQQKSNEERCFTDRAVKLMKDLLEIDDSKRVGVDKVLSYEFFKIYEPDIRAKQHSLKYKDSGVDSGMHTSSSTNSRKCSQRSLKVLDSGLDFLNSGHKEMTRSHDYPNPKTSLRYHKEYISQKSKERFGENGALRYEITNLPLRYNVPHCAAPPVYTSLPDKRERSVSEERRYKHSVSEDRRKQEFNRNYYRQDRSKSQNREYEYYQKSSQFDNKASKHSMILPPTTHEKHSQGNINLNLKSLVSNKHTSSSGLKREEYLPPRSIQHSSSTLERKLGRLNAVRLPPCRYSLKNISVVTILKNGDVCVEWLKTKNEKQYVSNVLVISSDGDRVTTYRPKPACLVKITSPASPKNPNKIQNFSFDELPQSFWKMYRKAKVLVDCVRANTPKITFYHKDFKCVMMENFPDPDFEMQFFDGGSITQKSGKISMTDKSGAKVENFDLIEISEIIIGSKYEDMWNKFITMKEWCISMEAHLEASKIKGICEVINYPVTFGNPPEKKFNGSSRDNG